MDALLGLSLKTSNIKLLMVCYFTILCCRDASVQKEKKRENRSVRSRVWYLVSAASEHAQFSLCLLPQQWFGGWKPPGASDDMMTGLCSLLTSSSSHRPHSLLVSQCRPGNWLSQKPRVWAEHILCVYIMQGLRIQQRKGGWSCHLYKEHNLYGRGEQVTGSNNKISEKKKMEQELWAREWGMR